jgi:N-acetylglutamate synthase-like GNAT family acetyltransferase
MIRICKQVDTFEIFEIINDAAKAYKGVIPDDRYNEPYMAMEELKNEISDEVIFWGFEENGKLLGVMGIQNKSNVSLIRHAYVRTNQRKNGIGSKLLSHLKGLSNKPILIGTWNTAVWAINFYLKNGFTLISSEEKDILLKTYWNISDRQIETSVVLCDNKWLKRILDWNITEYQRIS